MPGMNAFEKLAAAGMGQLVRHMMAGPFAIISAERADMNPKEKDFACRNLKHRLQKAGFGFIDTAGAWREETGAYNRESSVFVPGITAEQAEAMGREFGQEQVIVGDRGKYGFLGTQGDTRKPSCDLDLSKTLDVSSLDCQADLFTQIGNKQYVLWTNAKVPNPQRPGITFSPEEIEERRQRYEKLAPAAKFGPVVTKAVVVHQYEGNPPPQMAKFWIRGLGAPCPGEGGMIYCIPFAATFVEELPRFVPSADWGKPWVPRAATAEFTPIDEAGSGNDG